MPFYSFFDGPQHYVGKFNFFMQGSSPKLLGQLIASIEEHKADLVEINLCWYLYNNKILHDYLKGISNEGIKVNIITIPLEGYDHANPKTLKDVKTGARSPEAQTKYDLAKEIFLDIFHGDYPNYQLYFFSHLYVRSARVKKFSRGRLPYSLHIKAAYLKKKEGYIASLSSSNFAARDLVKHESLILLEDEADYESSIQQFFEDIIQHSIPIKEYTSKDNTSHNRFDFVPNKNNNLCFFTSPFYFDSANDLEKELLQLLSDAKQRIVICAQHLAAFQYPFDANYHSKINQNETRQGILSSVIEKAKEGVSVTCLSQTFLPPKGQFEQYKFRRPANGNNFQKFYTALSQSPGANYFVNENIHSKFIIVDDTLIFCTYNFTPTQFIFLDQVNIPRFEEMTDLSYEGIHCEVGGHVVINDITIVENFLAHARTIAKEKATVKVLG